MTDEQLEKIMMLDTRIEGNKEKLLNVLCNLPPFKKYKDEEEKEKFVTLEKLEKFVFKVVRKHCIDIQYINMTVVDNEDVAFYSASVRDAETYTWLGTVHGISFFELWAKMAVKVYAEAKKRGEDALTREELYKRRKKAFEEKNKSMEV